MKRVAVTGATGRQGGAVARALLLRGMDVVALTRRPASDEADTLAKLGARIVQGDLGDARSLRRALDGADAAWFVTVPEADPEAEVRQGEVQIAAALEAGCPHVIRSTVASCDRDTGIPGFEAKWRIEQMSAEAGLPSTVLRPTWFMENLREPPVLERLAAGRLRMPLRPRAALQMVALSDLGALVALAVEQRDRFLDRTLEVASDTLEPVLVAQSLGAVLGEPVRYEVEALDEEGPRYRLYHWLDAVGFDVDVVALHAELPEVGWHRFGRWAAAQDWSVLDAHRPVAGP